LSGREIRTAELGNGRSVHAVAAGEGADVVLIHGALNTSADWLSGPFDALASEGVRVTAIDRPGSGLSRRERFGGTPRAQAKQIREGFDQLGIERPILVAHSFGGLVALAYAELFPHALNQLILIAPLAFPEPRPLEHSFLMPRSAPFIGPFLSSAADATVDAPMLKLFQKLMFSPQKVPEHWERSYPYAETLTPEAMVAQGEDAAAVFPFAPAGLIDIGRIKTPAHIIHGTADKVVRVELHGRPLARLMPNARLTELEGVGHMPHQVRTDLLVNAVREALASA
jgi:pimeloyl-ACP methyl ester carboxylesterase